MEEDSSQEGDKVRFRLADLPARPEGISSTAVSPPPPSGQASLPESSENLRVSPSIAVALKPSTTTSTNRSASSKDADHPASEPAIIVEPRQL